MLLLGTRHDPGSNPDIDTPRFVDEDRPWDGLPDVNSLSGHI